MSVLAVLALAWQHCTGLNGEAGMVGATARRFQKGFSKAGLGIALRSNSDPVRFFEIEIVSWIYC